MSSQISEFMISPFNSDNKLKQNAHTSTSTANSNQISQTANKNLSFRCGSCQQHLNQLTEVKKRQIVLEYEVQKLKQEIEQLKKQRSHLIDLQHTSHKMNLEKYNPSLYFKEDLESQLKQTKYLLELHLLSNSSTSSRAFIKDDEKLLAHQKVEKLNSCRGKKDRTSQSQSNRQLQLQSQFNSLLSPYQPPALQTSTNNFYKQKSENLLLQRVKLEQQCMIKDKIIQERQLFPLYHYDDRVLMLRKNVEHWYRQAQQQTCQLKNLMQLIRSQQATLQKEFKVQLKKERLHWEGEIKKVGVELINRLLQKGQLREGVQGQQQVLALEKYNQSFCPSQRFVMDKSESERQTTVTFKEADDHHLRRRKKMAFVGSAAKRYRNGNSVQQVDKEDKSCCQCVCNCIKATGGKKPTKSLNTTTIQKAKKQSGNQTSLMNSCIQEKFNTIEIKSKKAQEKHQKNKHSHISSQRNSNCHHQPSTTSFATSKKINCKRCASKMNTTTATNI